MTTTPNAADYLKYAAARLNGLAEWATDSIGGAMCEGADHEVECNALTDISGEISAFAGLFGDPLVYSDGRAVTSSAQVDTGLSIRHTWHPDPQHEQPESWRRNLHHDPGTPCPGHYEVTTTPLTQEVNVRVWRLQMLASSGFSDAELS